MRIQVRLPWLKLSIDCIKAGKMDYSKIIDKFFTCPKCHKRHLRYWSNDLLSPEPSILASSSTAQQESREELQHLQDQGQYVCEHCKASFPESLFVFDRLEQIPAMQELEDRLKMLLNEMNEEQEFRYKQAVVRQAIHFVEEVLPPEELEDGHRGGIYLANKWLDEPTDERARKATIAAAAECIDGGVRHFDYPGFFLDPAFAAGAANTWKASCFAASAVMGAESHRIYRTIWGEEAKLVKAIAKYGALEWQTETAKAILCTAELPP